LNYKNEDRYEKQNENRATTLTVMRAVTPHAATRAAEYWKNNQKDKKGKKKGKKEK
jgi:hypothetical protein